MSKVYLSKSTLNPVDEDTSPIDGAGTAYSWRTTMVQNQFRQIGSGLHFREISFNKDGFLQHFDL